LFPPAADESLLEAALKLLLLLGVGPALFFTAFTVAAVPPAEALFPIPNQSAVGGNNGFNQKTTKLPQIFICQNSEVMILDIGHEFPENGFL